MPIFDYFCPACRAQSERIVSHAQSHQQACDDCRGLLQRAVAHVCNTHVAVVTGARMWDGSRVPGHFGKSAKRIRKQRP